MPEEKLTLVERRHEYGDVYTYFFEPEHPIPYEAGQYGHVRLFDMPPDVKAVREISFASASHEKYIWLGIDSRSHSPYQQKLLLLKPGDQIGLFKVKRHMQWPPEKSDVVMIAGGVGITPIRSFLRDRAHKQLPMTVSVVHVGSGSFLYGDEISTLATHYQATGRNELPGTLASIAKEHPRAAYYVSGSPGFVETVIEALRQSGISHIESDVFKGLAEEAVS